MVVLPHEKGKHIKGDSFSVLIPYGVDFESFEKILVGVPVGDRKEFFKKLGLDVEVKSVRSEVIESKSKSDNTGGSKKSGVKRVSDKEQQGES